MYDGVAHSTARVPTSRDLWSWPWPWLQSGWRCTWGPLL